MFGQIFSWLNDTVALLVGSIVYFRLKFPSPSIFFPPQQRALFSSLSMLLGEGEALCHIRAVTQVPLYSKSFQQPPPLGSKPLISCLLTTVHLDSGPLAFSSLDCGVDPVGMERIYRCNHPYLSEDSS